MSIGVLLVDDQSLFREGLRTLLSVYNDLTVVGEAENGRDAVKQATRLNPDVVLMDLRMPQVNGVEATRALHHQRPDIKVIILTTFDDDENVFDGLRAGAIGYLLKDVASEKLVEAIRAAAKGESILQPSVATKLLAEYTRLATTDTIAQSTAGTQPSLSERELQILREVARGASNKEIGSALFIAEGTVKNHLTNILGKLEAGNRTEAVNKARSWGWL